MWHLSKCEWITWKYTVSCRCNVCTHRQRTQWTNWIGKSAKGSGQSNFSSFNLVILLFFCLLLVLLHLCRERVRDNNTKQNETKKKTKMKIIRMKFVEMAKTIKKLHQTQWTEMLSTNRLYQAYCVKRWSTFVGCISFKFAFILFTQLKEIHVIVTVFEKGRKKMQWQNKNMIS